MDFSGFVLAAATNDLAAEPDARGIADAVEFRMDLAETPGDQLDHYDGELPLIVTNRAAWDGGKASEDGRLQAIANAVEHPAVEAVDVELRSIESGDAAADTEAARDNDVAVIASSHDFEATPSMSELMDRLARAADAGDVGKLAVMADEPGDVLRLLDATWRQTTEGRTVATMAMGEAGRHSRAICPLYGSRIGYAPVDPDEATAPGQLDLITLDSLIETLR